MTVLTAADFPTAADWPRGLPVAVALPPRLDAEVTRYVEAELGWQRVPLGGPPAPALLLGQAPHPGLPTVVVGDGTRPAAGWPGSAPLGALDVVVWPGEAGRLAACAHRLAWLRAQESARVACRPPALIRVGALASRTGASTVALATGALLAWAGRQAVVVTDEAGLSLAGVQWRGPGAEELAALSGAEAAAEFPHVAVRCRPVPGLWLLRARELIARPGPWPVDVVVWDAGPVRASDTVGLLVAPPQVFWPASARTGHELPGQAPTGRPRSGVVLRGPVAVGWLPWSARVTRAAVAGRVPADLPGSVLAELRRVLGWRR